jgi:hypothetical protein
MAFCDRRRDIARGPTSLEPEPRNMKTNTAGSLAVAALAACVGCASLPVTGVKPTGEPLGFDFETSQHGYMTSEKVGEVQYRGAAGQNLGHADIIRNKTVTYQKLEWTPRQGKTAISDEDFFRIAGLPDNADNIHAKVMHGFIASRVVMVVAAIGLGLLGVGLARHDQRMSGGGLLLTTVGGITVGVGGHALNPRNHVYPLDEAQSAANAYNQTLKEK